VNGGEKSAFLTYNSIEASGFEIITNEVVITM